MDPDNLAWLVQECTVALRAVGGLMTHEQPQIAELPSPAEIGREASAGESIWWSQSFSILPGPAIWIGSTSESWRALGRLVLSVQGIDQATSEDIQSACRDLVAQSTSALAQSLAGRFNAAVNCVELAEARPPDGVSTAAVTLTFPQPDTRIDLTLAFEPALLHRLSNSPRDGVTAGVSEPDALPQPIANLRLRVHVALGRTTLPLREIFKLTVGSVVELGRSIDDPVDIMINDTVIARGHVITCHGNYGIRVFSKLLAGGMGRSQR